MKWGSDNKNRPARPTGRPRRRQISSRLRTALSGRRGSAQLGLLVAAAAVAGGMTIGSGVASHNASSGYDLAWLADTGRGQVVQVDPVLGRSNVRLQVSAAGDQLEIRQSNGQLIVIDRRTGKISSINLGTLLVGGSRPGTPGGAVKVLLGGSRMYVANLASGSVQAVDPATEANIGRPWSAGRSLIDIGIDGRQDVWALDSTSRLTTLHWVPASSTLGPLATRSIAGAGAGSVIVAHARGVTVVGAHGTIARVGTSHDSNLSSPHVQGPLDGPTSSPDNIVPVSDPSRSTVVIVGNKNAVVDNVAALGCPRPGAPTVFDGKIYVPCSGSHLVLVLDAQGHQAGAPIPTPPGGDPQLTISGGRLLIDVPGSDTATVIDSSGDAHRFPTMDPGVGVQNPSKPPPPPPPPPPLSPPSHHNGGHRGHGDTPDHGGHGGGTGPTTPPGHPSSPAGPAGPSDPVGPGPGPGPGVGTATAQARPDGTVLVSWHGPAAAGGYTVTLADTGQQVAEVPAGADSATVTVLDPGTTSTLVVHAFATAGGQDESWSATTNPVTVLTTPGAATGVQVSLASHKGSVAKLSVKWSAALGNGGAVSYVVGASTTSTTTTTSRTSATIDVPCDTSCTGTVTVTARNAAGSASAASGGYDVAGTPATPPPGNPPANPSPANPPPANPPPPPANPAPPPGGLTMIQVTGSSPGSTDGDDAEVALTITLPASWQSWSGTCQLQDNGAPASDAGLSCSAATTTKQLFYGVRGAHSFTVVASGPGGTATSAAVSYTAVIRITCEDGYGAVSLTGGVNELPPPCNDCPQPTPGRQCIPRFLAPGPDTDRDVPDRPATATRPGIASRPAVLATLAGLGALTRGWQL